MSRTKHHRDRRVDCKEYWSRRPLSNAGGATPGRWTKVLTHRKERRLALREIVAVCECPEPGGHSVCLDCGRVVDREQHREEE